MAKKKLSLSPGLARRLYKQAQKSKKSLDKLFAALEKALPAKRHYKRGRRSDEEQAAEVRAAEAQPEPAPTDANGSPAYEAPCFPES